jgi:hypothetical protein
MLRLLVSELSILDLASLIDPNAFQEFRDAGAIKLTVTRLQHDHLDVVALNAFAPHDSVFFQFNRFKRLCDYEEDCVRQPEGLWYTLPESHDKLQSLAKLLRKNCIPKKTDFTALFLGQLRHSAFTPRQSHSGGVGSGRHFSLIVHPGHEKQVVSHFEAQLLLFGKMSTATWPDQVAPEDYEMKNVRYGPYSKLLIDPINVLNPSWFENQLLSIMKNGEISKEFLSSISLSVIHKAVVSLFGSFGPTFDEVLCEKVILFRLEVICRLCPYHVVEWYLRYLQEQKDVYYSPGLRETSIARLSERLSEASGIVEFRPA